MLELGVTELYFYFVAIVHDSHFEINQSFLVHCYVHYKVYGGGSVPEERVCNRIHDPLIGVVIDQRFFKTGWVQFDVRIMQ